MLTGHERTQLEMAYRREPASPRGMLLACAAGLLMVVLLILIGWDLHAADQQILATHAGQHSR